MSDPRVRMIAAIVLVGAVGGAAAQQPSFKATTGVVSLFATVVDADKRLVPDLTKDAFEVFDNDKPQTIAVFDNEVRPITVVVLLDTSLSMTGNLKLVGQAAEQFLIRLLPDDKAKIGTFNDKVKIDATFSGNRDALVGELKDLDYGNSTHLYDALLQGIDDLQEIEGRRVVLVFTDGDDYGSHSNLGTVIDRARADEVMAYAIGFQSEYFDGQRMVRSKPDRGLQKLADETGGGYFELKKSSELGPTFSRVALELHSQYVIGFEPAQLDGKVHKLTLRVKHPGMVARARRSYLATPTSKQQ
jgi:Ca-activated chloride channel family protein